jgi:hypothetical protein
MSFDPDEIVSTSDTVGPVTLRTAVRQLMAKPPSERTISTVYRSGEPPILDSKQIEALAAEWGI